MDEIRLGLMGSQRLLSTHLYRDLASSDQAIVLDVQTVFLADRTQNQQTPVRRVKADSVFTSMMLGAQT